MYPTLGLFMNHWLVKIIAENVINNKNRNDLARNALRPASPSQMKALGHVGKLNLQMLEYLLTTCFYSSSFSSSFNTSVSTFFSIKFYSCHCLQLVFYPYSEYGLLRRL